jgi:outer membrane protein OmpA-like peptidoglycan-associated protein
MKIFFTRTALSFCTLLLCSASAVKSQVHSRTSDTAFLKQRVVLRSIPEADYLFRIGDIDNFGQGWPDKFDPFCDVQTDGAGLQCKTKIDDLLGFDKAVVSSAIKPGTQFRCGKDALSVQSGLNVVKGFAVSISLDELKGSLVKNAILQLHIADLQAKQYCSHYSLKINGVTYTEGEEILNHLEMPEGFSRLISLPLPPDVIKGLASNTKLEVKIDDMNASGDAIAVDFVRLLVNPNMSAICKGELRGRVIQQYTELSLGGAEIILPDQRRFLANEKGEFSINDIPVGTQVLHVVRPDNQDLWQAVDVFQGKNENELLVTMEAARRTIPFLYKDMRVGDKVVLNQIHYSEQRNALEPGDYPALMALYVMMKDNPSLQIELDGHSLLEGDAFDNWVKSYLRANSCKTFLVQKGISPSRILVFGWGMSQAIRANGEPEETKVNERVEFRFTHS